ncbi:MULTISPECIES: hypothetical protein [Pseudoalteromonas]|uniref:Uncharacterized protein n=1 Tax=Pseudoalteromonas amylolytica TaxID=1859457 RepID=A0A1S1MWH6_9GAMM|nr:MULTISPECIES: hypothetical protein [Pseudoalteromonas]OHU89201.1 hypothetical protein BFC16_06070 [Pseudoalteromonas sp. JW3]OHU92101.1 hypothetical protein BET10_07175 [Pseudoalteromonas amylolytica]
MKKEDKPIEVQTDGDSVTVTFNGAGWAPEHTRLLEFISGRNHKHGKSGTGFLMSMMDSYVNTLYPNSIVEDEYEDMLDTEKRILDGEAREAAGLPPKGLKFYEP